jgi:hypothetical protein
MTTLRYRLMTAADIGSVPIGHMGTEDEVRDRIAALGSAAQACRTDIAGHRTTGLHGVRAPFYAARSCQAIG